MLVLFINPEPHSTFSSQVFGRSARDYANGLWWHSWTWCVRYATCHTIEGVFGVLEPLELRAIEPIIPKPSSYHTPLEILPSKDRKWTTWCTKRATWYTSWRRRIWSSYWWWWFWWRGVELIFLSLITQFPKSNLKTTCRCLTIEFCCFVKRPSEHVWEEIDHHRRNKTIFPISQCNSWKERSTAPVKEEKEAVIQALGLGMGVVYFCG